MFLGFKIRVKFTSTRWIKYIFRMLSLGWKTPKKERKKLFSSAVKMQKHNFFSFWIMQVKYHLLNLGSFANVHALLFLFSNINMFSLFQKNCVTVELGEFWPWFPNWQKFIRPPAIHQAPIRIFSKKTDIIELWPIWISPLIYVCKSHI